MVSVVLRQTNEVFFVLSAWGRLIGYQVVVIDYNYTKDPCEQGRNCNFFYPAIQSLVYYSPFNIIMFRYIHT